MKPNKVVALVAVLWAVLAPRGGEANVNADGARLLGPSTALWSGGAITNADGARLHLVGMYHRAQDTWNQDDARMLLSPMAFLLSPDTVEGEGEPHEGEPVVEGEPVTEGELFIEGEPVVEGEPVTEGESVEGEPVTEGESVTEGEPLIEGEGEGESVEGEIEGEPEEGEAESGDGCCAGCGCSGDVKTDFKRYLGDYLLIGLSLLTLLALAAKRTP